MSALQRLKNRLTDQHSQDIIEFSLNDRIAKTIEELKTYVGKGTIYSLNKDIQIESLNVFSSEKKLNNYKIARLVTFGLYIPYDQTRVPLIENTELFNIIIDEKVGIDQWIHNTVLYRRCYQGLITSYFSYDGISDQVPETGRNNWIILRDYLNSKINNIIYSKHNPDWVSLLLNERDLLSNDPCKSYAIQLLRGEDQPINIIKDTLRISDASWFVRELIISQVRYTTGLNDREFKSLIPTIIKLIADNLILRDQCLILILNRYSSCSEIEINEQIKNSSVDWWGNPWLPSNETRWGGVIPQAREMIADWLKSEFVEAFFSKLAEDGVGDKRRANFWLKYVRSMDNVQFALGSQALRSTDRDFVALRKKMKGLYAPLNDSDENNNAFVMTIGKLVIVEFGSSGNAMYAYDNKNNLPFDMSKELAVRVDYSNSLKSRSSAFKMSHIDGSRHGDKWEDRFRNKLSNEYSIFQNIDQIFTEKLTKPSTRSDNFNLFELYQFAHSRKLKVEDFNANGRGGNIWVRTSDEDPEINNTLINWNFKFKPGKGWWR